METSINKLNLLNIISRLENEHKVLRKVTITDLHFKENNIDKVKHKLQDKVKDYRKQEEHGEKKFIKP